MKCKISLILAVGISIFFTFYPGMSFGDSAQVLPKGISSVGITFYNYFDITESYDSDGNAEDIAADYNRPLDSSVFTDLAGLDSFVPDGTATVGDAVVDFTRILRNWEFTYSYGLSDKVSIGILIPFNDVENNVNAYLDTTTADVGKNPGYTLAGFNIANPATYPVIPTGFGGQPLSTDDIMDLLGPGLDVDNNGTVEGPEPVGYGYDPVEDWSGSDIGDIDLVAKYKFYDKDKWRMAFTGGLTLPTGKTDDPDNLVDIASGNGQTDLLFKLHTDYTGVEKLFLNATARLKIQLPDEETLRVLNDPDLPLTPNKEKVDRDLGDIVELEMMGNYSLSRDWSVGLRYKYTRKFKDKVDGDLGFVYSALEDQTDSTSHMGFLSIGYSTVQKYLDKEASVPFNVGLAYRNRFAGTNGVTKSEYVSLNFGMYF